MTTTQAKLDAIKAVGDAVISAVSAAGKLGCPGGTLYAALMSYGCSLEVFEKLMAALVAVGKIEKRGQLYFVVEAK